MIMKSMPWHNSCVMLEVGSIILKENSNSRICYVNIIVTSILCSFTLAIEDVMVTVVYVKKLCNINRFI